MHNFNFRGTSPYFFRIWDEATTGFTDSDCGVYPAFLEIAERFF